MIQAVETIENSKDHIFFGTKGYPSWISTLVINKPICTCLYYWHWIISNHIRTLSEIIDIQHETWCPSWINQQWFQFSCCSSTRSRKTSLRYYCEVSCIKNNELLLCPNKQDHKILSIRTDSYLFCTITCQSFVSNRPLNISCCQRRNNN